MDITKNLYGLICKNIMTKGIIIGLALAILVSISITPFVSAIISNTIDENNPDLLIVISTGSEEMTIIVPVPEDLNRDNTSLGITIVNLGDETITLKKGVIIGDKGEMSTQLSGELKGAGIDMEDYLYAIKYTGDKAIEMYYFGDKKFREIVDKQAYSMRRVDLNYDSKIITSYNLSSEESAGNILKRKIIIYYEKNGEIKTSEIVYEIKLKPFNLPSTPVTPEEEKIYLGGPTKENKTFRDSQSKEEPLKPPSQEPNYNNYIILAIILITIFVSAFVIWYKKFKRCEGNFN